MSVFNRRLMADTIRGGLTVTVVLTNIILRDWWLRNDVTVTACG